MGNAALAGELVSTDELEELYELDASESEPEDDGEDDDGSDDESAGESGGESGGGEDIEPEEIPHG
jgi:hypothetical protein